MEAEVLTYRPEVSPASFGRKPWRPERVMFTRAALDEPFGQSILERVEALGLPVEKLAGNRLVNLKGKDERDTYRRSKRTMGVVVAPPGALKLQPIPPSADWQFHLAEGCPAHCQYCYLAGSLTGPPAVRVFANLPAILENSRNYERPDAPQSFEVSCYTDPLGIEHLTGSLAECIRHFGTRPGAQLRWVSKFDRVDPLIGLPHHGQTRCRASINAEVLSKTLDHGTPAVADRLAALRKLALPPERGGGGYPVGLVVAPIMPVAGWEDHYGRMFDAVAAALDFPCDLTFELITHRFTPGSKQVLREWYPGSQLDMDEATRVQKRNKFGGIKFVYPKDIMGAMKRFFADQVAAKFPRAELLYWT